MKTILLDTSIDYTSWDINEVGSIEMTDWQPIETAPIKTDILISAKYIPLEWEKDNDKYKNTIYDYFIASRAYKDSPYWDACGSSLICHNGGEGEHCVTHWMPLPAPPKKGDE